MNIPLFAVIIIAMGVLGGFCGYFLGLWGLAVICPIAFIVGGIYQEGAIQTSSYRELLIENGYLPAEKIIILGLPRTDEETLQEVTFTNFEPCWEMFKHLREVYELQKRIKV